MSSSARGPFPAKSGPDPTACGVPDAADCDVRCICGSLLIKKVQGGLELKCRRCKRITIIPWDENSS